MEQKCHMLGCGEDAYRVTGHFSPMDMSLRIKAATLRVLLTREGHTTVRKYCQPTSTLLTRMCWAREALIIYFSAEHIFSRNAEKCNYQECEVLHRRPPVIGGGDDSK